MGFKVSDTQNVMMNNIEVSKSQIDNKLQQTSHSIFDDNASKKKTESETESETKSENLLKIVSGILLGGAVLSIIGIGMLVAGRRLNHKLSCIKQLEKNIDFKPAKTLEDAVEFAKKQLGIKKYNIDNLDIANLINHGLVNVSNKCQGKLFMPDSVMYGCPKDAAMAVTSFFGHNTLFVNKKYYTEHFLHKQKLNDFVKYFLQHTPEHIISLKDTTQAASEVTHIATTPMINTDMNPLLTVYHELGHLDRIGRLPFRFHEHCRFDTEFLSNPEKQRIASLVSNYAKTNAEEFCSEVYSLLIDGSEKIPQEVLNLYKSYGGTLIA